ncbi:MAG: FtsX-like permease family protein [Solirubrobacteraceae bacterium]
MLASYVRRDLVRNPRRTLAALAGVTLGVGLFSGVLFFIDGSGASMTKRALAPLVIDMQRVIGSSAGVGLQLGESISPQGRVGRGAPVTVTLTVANRGAVPANEVVVNDRAPETLAYLPGTTTLDGRRIADPAVGTPLSQGAAMIGLNLGTVKPHATVTLTYHVRASASVDTRSLGLRGRISSRENLIPTGANAAQEPPLGALAATLGTIPGVASADQLMFVDLPPGSLSSGAATIHNTVRVFGFSSRYQQHYPSIRIVGGSLRGGAAALSVEASRALGTRLGGGVDLRLPGRTGLLHLPVSATADLSRAKPLFYSRKAGDLEAFLYLPNAIVVDPATFSGAVIPAFRAASATRGQVVKNQPLLEVDVRVRRSRLQADPGTALAQTLAIASRINRIAPGQDYLIDNASNTLQVARDDAAVAKRMFLFLGLPGALLAAFLAAYAGSILASAQRRDQALLRIRGAHRGHLLRMLVYRTLALAGTGALLGTALGLFSVIVILGPGTLFEAAPGSLALSAWIGVGLGMLATALALYVPGRRSLHREISQDRAEMALGSAPAWRRMGLDFVVLAATIVAEVVALRSGAFDAQAGSVYQGRGVSLPSHLLLAPVGAWMAGVLLSVRVFDAISSRIRLPAAPRFGSPVLGSLARSVRRRSWSLAGGVVAVGLVVAFGTSLVIFTDTYDAAKAADARFTVGSDLRVTPSVLSTRPHPASFASQLTVAGVAASTPVVFKPENAVLTTAFNEDRKSLVAIEPASFMQVAALADRFFVDSSASRALTTLQRNPRSVLIDQATAQSLKVALGDTVQVLLARGTSHQTAVKVHVAGFFERFPGFPQGVNIVANLSLYEAATHSRAADFFLARTTDSSAAGLDAALASLQAGPGAHDVLNIDTTSTTLDKDQSSLTALNVHGLLDLDLFYTLLMAAAGIAMFVFGLMLQRRREYVTFRAQGMQTRELRALVLGETAVVTVFGLIAGLLVGTAMGYLFVHVLQPLFILHRGASLSVLGTATLVLLVLAAAVASALAATELLRRLRPTELLRET